MCKIADHYKGENDPTQDIPALQQNKFHPFHDSDVSSRQQNIEDLMDMGFNMPNYSSIPAMRNTAPQQPVDMRSGASVPTSKPRPQEGSWLNTPDPTYNRGKAQIINSFTDPQEPQEQQKKSSKGGKKKSSQGAQSKNQPQLSTSSHTSTSNTRRPLVHCSACGGGDHLRKDCHQDSFCTRCRSRSHNTEMYHTPMKTERVSNICIYCGSKRHSPGKCTNRPNDNREEPRSIPRDLQENRFGNTDNSNHFLDQNKGSHQ